MSNDLDELVTELRESKTILNTQTGGDGSSVHPDTVKAAADAITRLRPKWSTEAPTVAGWYWARVLSSGFRDVLEVREIYGQLSWNDVRDSAWRPMSHAKHFQWSDKPLPEPEE